ncbi:hypothetical protein HPB47_011546 [Ixodes persulcatus]|uniref:Uncharacterized protein n=1 Tax=Ixodes persulcatus TaxID=34615 RepID=A0AC60NW12_IXOPE|nr:hypothetical protein HPB47_011546 [Ixodes persulcatus]
MAARSSSANAALDGGGADTGVPGAARVSSRGPTPVLRSIRRTVMQETVSKSVTERKASTKQVTDKATGTEQRHDSHIETNTSEEVSSKRQEETIELYDGVVHHAAGVATSEPTLAERVAVPHQVETSVPDLTGFSVSSPEKKTKLPVTIRVKDDEQAAPEVNAVGTPEESVLPTPSILRPLSQEESEKRPGHRLGWHQEDKIQPFSRSLLPPPVPREAKDEEDEEEVAEPPPSRLNMRRKDSIAVAKLRIMRQQEHPSQEEDLTEEDLSPTSPDKKHPSFLPATVISIISEQAEEESELPVSAFNNKPDVPSEEQPVASSTEAVLATKVPETTVVSVEEHSSETTLEQAKTDSEQGKEEVKISSSETLQTSQKPMRVEEIDSTTDVVSSKTEKVATYENASVTSTEVNQVVKKKQSSLEIVGQEAEHSGPPAPLVATVVEDVSSHLQTPMDKRGARKPMFKED